MQVETRSLGGIFAEKSGLGWAGEKDPKEPASTK